MANTLYPVTKTIVPVRDGFSAAAHTLVKRAGGVFPVTHKFVVKSGQDWLDEFQGGILECYNFLPLLNWGWADPTGHEPMTPNRLMYGTRTINMAFANRNFAFNTAHPWLSWPFVNDVLGIYLTYRDEHGDMAFGWQAGWDQMIQYYLANGGGKGVCISPYQTTNFFEAYNSSNVNLGNPQNMPTAHTDPSSNGILRFTDTISTSGIAGGYGFFYEVIQQNSISPQYRNKDMVLWIYQCDIEGGHNVETINTGMFHPSYLCDWNAAENRFDFKIREYPPDPKWAWFMGSTYHINDDISNPGDTAVRLISNHYKYEPWARYPNL